VLREAAIAAPAANANDSPERALVETQTPKSKTKKRDEDLA
jgi:hypothetical protein